MTVDLLAPAMLALVAGSLGGWLRRRLPPRVAVVLLTLVAVAAAAGVVMALALIVVGGVVGVPDALGRVWWCRSALTAGHKAPAVVATGAAAMLVVGLVRLVLFERQWRRSVAAHDREGGIAVVDADEPIAFAVPSAEGTVVVSRGLLAVLDRAEQAALFAHEHCHLSRGHHRFLRASGRAAAAVPVLTLLARHVRFATEREADEAAAAAVGDRRVVARAIASAAVGVRLGSPAMALGDHGVVERLDELLNPPPPSWLPAMAVTAGLAAAFVVLSSSTLQLHHLVEFGAHVCGLD